MKNIIILLALLLFSCTKEDPIIPKNVSFTLDYYLPVPAGNLSKGNPFDYTNFYNKYIAGRILTPKYFDLNLVNLDTRVDEHVGGAWAENQIISIPTGTYHVSGTSTAHQSFCDSICSFSFDDTITITTATITLKLEAKYACALILVDPTIVGQQGTSIVISDLQYPNPDIIRKGMMKTENLCHLFIRDEMNTSSSRFRIYLIISGIDPDPSDDDFVPGTGIVLTNFKWEMGKYYFLENTGNSFTIPPMIAGK